MSTLSGLSLRRDPPVYRCACGCGEYADRGYPGDRWYATAHVPPYLRFAWETGACSPWPRVPLTVSGAERARSRDLFSSAPADASRRPT